MTDKYKPLLTGTFTAKKFLTCLQLAIDDPQIGHPILTPGMLYDTAMNDSRELRSCVGMCMNSVAADCCETTASDFPRLVFNSIVDLPGFRMAGCIGEVALKIYLYRLLCLFYWEEGQGSPGEHIMKFAELHGVILKQQVELILAEVRRERGLPFRFDALEMYGLAELWDDYKALKAEMEHWIRPDDASENR